MPPSDSYTVFCIIVGEDSPFSIKVAKSGTVSDLKELIKKETPSTFRGIGARFLDLYHAEFTEDDELMANVKAHPLNSPLLATALVMDIFPCTPKKDMIHLLVKPSSKRPASTELERVAKRREMIKQLPSIGRDPATQEHVAALYGDKIVYNRPESTPETIPLALLHEVFGVFLQECQDHVPTQADNRFLATLRYSRLATYGGPMRRFEFTGAIKHHSKALQGTDELPFFMDAQFSVNGHLMLVAEGGEECTGLRADPLLEAFMQYIASLKSRQGDKLTERLPCLILYYVGTFMGFAGAIVADKPMLELLTPLFTFQENIHDLNASRPLARSLGALNHALNSLKEYYTQLETAQPADRTVCTNPAFPYRTYYTAAEGKVEFQYILRLHPEKLVFLCSRANDETYLCVKFTQAYSKAAHQHCADNGVAPPLYAIEELPGGWLMVVMGYLERDAYDLLLYSSSGNLGGRVQAAVTEAVGILHRGGFVHGDIRDVNTMVAKDWDDKKGVENIKLLDFEWAGPEGNTLYPPYVNHQDVKRPQDARDGLPILKDHDLEMVGHIFK